MTYSRTWQTERCSFEITYKQEPCINCTTNKWNLKKDNKSTRKKSTTDVLKRVDGPTHMVSPLVVVQRDNTLQVEH